MASLPACSAGDLRESAYLPIRPRASLVSVFAAELWFVLWGVFVVLVWFSLAGLAALDVKRRGGPAGWTLALSILFWPMGLYLWARQRGRTGSRW